MKSKVEVPVFREVYKKIEKDNHILVVCELYSIETDEKLAFGISKCKTIQHFNPKLGKKIAFGLACTYLFMKYNGGKRMVDDQVGD